MIMRTDKIISNLCFPLLKIFYKQIFISEFNNNQSIQQSHKELVYIGILAGYSAIDTLAINLRGFISITPNHPRRPPTKNSKVETQNLFNFHRLFAFAHHQKFIHE